MTTVYRDWIDGLRDHVGRARIQMRVDRLAHGNPGVHRNLRGGVSELKIDFGPGYRVYFTEREGELIVLLAGGDKSTQSKGIELAIQRTEQNRTEPLDETQARRGARPDAWSFHAEGRATTVGAADRKSGDGRFCEGLSARSRPVGAPMPITKAPRRTAKPASKPTPKPAPKKRSARTPTVAYDMAKQLRTPEEMAAYLEAWLVEAPEDTAGIARALGDIARACGMTKVAREAGLSRESLYKALSEGGNPSFDTVLRVARAMGLRFHASAA